MISYEEVIYKVLKRLNKDINDNTIHDLEKSLGIDAESRTEDYKRWSLDSTFMSIAYVVSKCSHDSNTQHGSVIVDEKNHIVSTGFNGFLSGSFDDKLPNNRINGKKYDHMIHSERNALDQSTRADLSGCRIYITGVPCNTCFRAIISRGIREVIIGDVGHKFENDFWETHHFLAITHGVQVKRFSGTILDTSKTITIGTENEASQESN